MGSSPIWRGINDNTLLCTCFADSSSVAFRGCVEIEVLSGVVSIFGYNLDSSQGKIQVLSSAAECAYTINVLRVGENGTTRLNRIRQTFNEIPVKWINETDVEEIVELAKDCCVLLFHRYETLSTASFQKHHPAIFNNRSSEDSRKISQEKYRNSFVSWIAPGQDSILKLSTEWIELANTIADLYMMRGNDLRILVTGGKNSGKSALIKYLTNFLQNDHNDVYHMECDPGQPEFTQQGCLSLTEITKPILAPPFFNQRQPLVCYFAGGVNVTLLPGHYVECIKKLHKSYQDYHEKSPKPLFVNTMGHFKGIGVKLLFDVIAIVKPTHIIQLTRGLSKIWNLPSLSKEYLSSSGDGWSNRVSDSALDYELITIQSQAFDKEPLYRAPILRQFGLLSYFLRLQTDSSLRSIHEYVPYVVKWCDVALFCCNETVPNHQIMYALNGTVVALCSCSNFQKLPTLDNSLPKFLSEMPDGEWFGYGVIRGIDMQKKLFYIITPTPKENLQFVNALIKSSIDLPHDVILKQNTDVQTPYVMKSVLKHRLIGTKALKKRTYRERRSARPF